jgi:hypothetical protein
MSLVVSDSLIDRAKAGPVTDEEFLGCIAESLPYAWTVITRATTALTVDGGQFAVDNTDPPSVAEQGQLLRFLASSSMRAAIERHLNVKIEFQNCCKVAVFDPAAVGGPEHSEFISPNSQLLNQAPGLVNC